MTKMKNTEQAERIRADLDAAQEARLAASKTMLSELSARAASGPFYLNKAESKKVYDTLVGASNSVSTETELADVYDIALNRVPDARNPDMWAGLIVVALHLQAVSVMRRCRCVPLSNTRTRWSK